MVFNHNDEVKPVDGKYCTFHIMSTMMTIVDSEAANKMSIFDFFKVSHVSSHTRWMIDDNTSTKKFAN